MQILRIKNSKRDGIKYIGRKITFNETKEFDKFISDISEKYANTDKGELNSFLDIRKYDGSALGKTIYKLSKDNTLIQSEYSALLKSVSNPDEETDPLKFKAQAYLLYGTVKINDTEQPVKLISMQNPVTTLKHKFLKQNDKFQEINNKVLTLRLTIDVVIFNDYIYMLTLAGEKLFNMERSYKLICNEKVNIINNCDIITNFIEFEKIAKRGQNPRKFVSFNDKHLKELKKPETRKKISQKFNIPLKGKKFNTDKTSSSEKIIKLLCNKGMLEPFEETPMEVAGSKQWA